MDDTLSAPPEPNAVVWITFSFMGLFYLILLVTRPIVLLPPALTAYTLRTLYYQESKPPIFDFELENPIKLLWFYIPVLLLALTRLLSTQYRMTRPQITLVTFWVQIIAATLIRVLNVYTWVAQDYTSIKAWEGVPWLAFESLVLSLMASSRKESRPFLMITYPLSRHGRNFMRMTGLLETRKTWEEDRMARTPDSRTEDVPECMWSSIKKDYFDCIVPWRGQALTVSSFVAIFSIYRILWIRFISNGQPHGSITNTELLSAILFTSINIFDSNIKEETGSREDVDEERGDGGVLLEDFDEYSK